MSGDEYLETPRSANGYQRMSGVLPSEPRLEDVGMGVVAGRGGTLPLWNLADGSDENGVGGANDSVGRRRYDDDDDDEGATPQGIGRGRGSGGGDSGIIVDG